MFLAETMSFMSTFVSSTSSHLHVILEERHRLETSAYMVLIANTRIKHYRVKQLTICSDPQMPVLAVGVLLNQEPATALVHPRALADMVGAANSAMGEQPAASPTIDRDEMSHG